MRCSVVTDLSSGDTVIIDGGSESDRLISWINNFEGLGPDWSNGPNTLEEMEQYGITSRNVVALVNTHAHFDHSGEIPLLLRNMMLVGTYITMISSSKASHKVQL